jgi:hypothetical protein
MSSVFRGATLAGLLAGISCFLSTASLCADDGPQPERLPPPKSESFEVIEPEPAPIVHFPRRSYYAVWDLYGVSRNGHFRPRVIYAPQGAYYLYNGEAYPWVTTHELDIMPYIVD